MTSLSERLGKGRATVRHRMPEAPDAVIRAAASIARSWPDVEVDRVEEDPERLVRELERRRSSGDWNEFFWPDVVRASIALIDSGLWRKKRYERVLEFLLAQVRPGVNRPYLRTLFRKYLDTFDPESRLTQGLARVLKDRWRETALPIDDLVTQFRIFDIDPSPGLVIAEFMIDQDQPFAALQRLGVEAPHGEGLMAAAHGLFVSSVAPRIATGDVTATETLLSWLKPDGEEHPLEGAGAAQAIDALLEPWKRKAPNSDLQRLIEIRLLAAYFDPRIHRSGVWSLVSEDAKRVIFKWLAGDTIEIFFDIVTKAVSGDPSEHMWPTRRTLWTDLFEQDRITEAWFALSEAGTRVADRLQSEGDETPLAYGRNHSQSSQDRNKCLLIMKVQGRWVVEGSHNFPTWVFPPGGSAALEPYEDSYTCEQFREQQYITGPGQPDRIVHLGDWRNKVLTTLG